MAQYTKLTPAIFKKKLADGEYKEIKGARRAVGRMAEWSEQDRDTARTWVNKHFGEVPEKKEAPKVKPVVVTTASKKAAAAKAAPKKAAKAQAAPKKVAAPKAEPKVKAPKAAGAPRGRKPKAQEPTNSDRIRDVHDKVVTLQVTLSTMKQAGELGASDTEVAAGARRAQAALVQVVDEIMGMTGGSPVSTEDTQKIELLKKVAPKGNSAAEHTAPTA